MKLSLYPAYIGRDWRRKGQEEVTKVVELQHIV